jgi:hypothetical protein
VANSFREGVEAMRREAIAIVQSHGTRPGRNPGEPETTREMILGLILADLRTAPVPLSPDQGVKDG